MVAQTFYGIFLIPQSLRSNSGLDTLLGFKIGFLDEVQHHELGCSN